MLINAPGCGPVKCCLQEQMTDWRQHWISFVELCGRKIRNLKAKKIKLVHPIFTKKQRKRKKRREKMGVEIKIQKDHLQGVGDHCLQDGWPLKVHVSTIFCMFCLPWFFSCREESFWIVLMSIYPTETNSSGKWINKWCLVYILTF